MVQFVEFVEFLEFLELVEFFGFLGIILEFVPNFVQKMDMWLEVMIRKG